MESQTSKTFQGVRAWLKEYFPDDSDRLLQLGARLSEAVLALNTEVLSKQWTDFKEFVDHVESLSPCTGSDCQNDHEVVLDILRKQNYRIGRGALGILILYEQRKEEWEKDKKTLESEFDNSEDCIQKREDSKKKEEEATLLIKDTLDDLRVSGRFLELMDSPMKRRWVCMVKRGKVKEQKLDNPGRMRDAIMILINEMDGTDWDESKFSIEG